MIGDIDDVMYKSFVEFLDDNKNSAFEIELSSHGGDALMAIAIYEKIRKNKKKVTINASGIVASAAVIILAAGHQRTLTSNSWVMVHEDEIMVETTDRVSVAEKKLEVSRNLETQWNALLENATGTQASNWQYLHMNEEWMTPAECLQWGLIDKILEVK